MSENKSALAGHNQSAIATSGSKKSLSQDNTGGLTGQDFLPTLRQIPELGKMIGDREAQVLLQVDYLVQKASRGNVRDGRKWTYQSLRDLEQYFAFSYSTINRKIHALRRQGYILEANYNRHKYDRTRWLTLSEKGIRLLHGFLLPRARGDRLQIADHVFDLETGEITVFHNDKSNLQSDKSNLQSDKSNLQSDKSNLQNDTTIPENTPQNTDNRIPSLESGRGGDPHAKNKNIPTTSAALEIYLNITRVPEQKIPAVVIDWLQTLEDNDWLYHEALRKALIEADKTKGHIFQFEELDAYYWTAVKEIDYYLALLATGKANTEWYVPSSGYKTDGFTPDIAGIVYNGEEIPAEKLSPQALQEATQQAKKYIAENADWLEAARIEKQQKQEREDVESRYNNLNDTHKRIVNHYANNQHLSHRGLAAELQVSLTAVKSAFGKIRAFCSNVGTISTIQAINKLIDLGIITLVGNDDTPKDDEFAVEKWATLWEQTKISYLRGAMTQATFDTHLAHTRVLYYDDKTNELAISANKHSIEWLNTKLEPPIHKAFFEKTGLNVTIVFYDG